MEKIEDDFGRADATRRIFLHTLDPERHPDGNWFWQPATRPNRRLTWNEFRKYEALVYDDPFPGIGVLSEFFQPRSLEWAHDICGTLFEPEARYLLDIPVGFTTIPSANASATIISSGEAVLVDLPLLVGLEAANQNLIVNARGQTDIPTFFETARKLLPFGKLWRLFGSRAASTILRTAWLQLETTIGWMRHPEGDFPLLSGIGSNHFHWGRTLAHYQTLFVLLHEFAHIHLGHLKASEDASSQAVREAEYAADCQALQWIMRLAEHHIPSIQSELRVKVLPEEARNCVVAAIAMLLIVFLLLEDTREELQDHPYPSHRMQRLCTAANDRSFGTRLCWTFDLTLYATLNTTSRRSLLFHSLSTKKRLEIRRLVKEVLTEIDQDGSRKGRLLEAHDRARDLSDKLRLEQSGPSESILDELRTLARVDLNDGVIRKLFAESLASAAISQSNDVCEPSSQKLKLQELRALATCYPDDLDVADAYAGALVADFRAAIEAPRKARTATLGELRELLLCHPEDTPLRDALVTGLFFAAANPTLDPSQQATLIDELKALRFASVNEDYLGDDIFEPLAELFPEFARLNGLTTPASSRVRRDLRMGLASLGTDDALAVKYFRLAADQGNAQAQSSLGAAHMEGRGGLEKDDREAVRLFRLSADQGNPAGRLNLGVAYMEGRGGLEKNDRDAVHLFRLVADEGNSDGQIYLARAYMEGRGGLEKDDREAVRLFHLAAEEGNAKGQTYLGLAYLTGLGGLPKDQHQGIRLLRKAASRRDDLALQFLHNLQI
jgi:TPR repeat protein